MTRQRPSLRSIEVFAEVAKAGSITRAADRMGLTASAVSKRIAELEGQLGRPLLKRLHRRIELTAAGERLAQAAGAALADLDRTIDALRLESPADRLRITTLQSFASVFLMPRLARLRQKRPGLTVEVETGSAVETLQDGRFDAAVRFGKGNWPGLAADRLTASLAIPFAKPGMLPPGARPDAELIGRLTLLTVAPAEGIWREWLAAVGLPEARPRRVERFDNASLALEAAANGMGLVLVIALLAGPWTDAGRLAPAFDMAPIDLGYSYWLAYPPAMKKHAGFQALRRELLAPA